MVTEQIRAEFEAATDKLAYLNSLREFLFSLSPQKHNPVDLVRWVPLAKVKCNDYNPNSVATNEMKLLYTSISHDGYCVEESTPILKADLTWVAAGTLVAGDRLVAFDEFPTGAGNGRKQRRYRTSIVLSNFVEASALVEVSTDKGGLLTTADHPFLARRCYGKGHHLAEWIKATDLKPDDVIIHLMQPWSTDTSYLSGWLSGFLDGEGTLSHNQTKDRKQTYRLAGYQRPGQTANRMIEEMSRRAITKVFVVERPESHKWASMVMARVDRLTEIMRLLGSVRPDRLIEGAGEFWEDCALSSKLKNESKSFVRSVLPAGMGKIARLSTSTKTYIANGFAVHNTQPIVTVYDEEADNYCIVDGFHRYLTMRVNADLQERNGGKVPIVVLDKQINDRMASTVRHNRARGKHSVIGMASMVYSMLENGWGDEQICGELGLEIDELVRLKHVTGFSKLFQNVEYRRAWQTKRQIQLKRDYRDDEGKSAAGGTDAGSEPADRSGKAILEESEE